MTGTFFDGKSSRRRPVTMALEVEQVVLFDADGALVRREPTTTLRLAEASEQGPVILRFPDGASCHFPASVELHQVLQDAGVPLAAETRFFAAITSSARMLFLTVGFLVATAAAAFIWLIPLVAEVTVPWLPEDLTRRVGQEVLAALDRAQLKPSKVPKEKQVALERALNDLIWQNEGKVTLHLRSNGGGPNAWALPGRILLVTDELMDLLKDDMEAMSGIMAHELGHMKHNHGLRLLVQASLLQVLTALIIGDFSPVLAAAPAYLGYLKYSRVFEAQADQDGYRRLCARGKDPAHTARFFEQMDAKYGELEEMIPAYLNTHGASKRRAAFFREPCPVIPQ